MLEDKNSFDGAHLILDKGNKSGTLNQHQAWQWNAILWLKTPALNVNMSHKLFYLINDYSKLHLWF